MTPQELRDVLLKIATLLNVDFEELVARFERQVARQWMQGAVPALKRRSQKEKIRPKELSDTDAEKRQLVRYHLYWLCKGLVPWGPIADIVRDAIDDDTVAEVAPQVAPGMGIDKFIGLVLEAAVRNLPTLNLPD